MRAATFVISAFLSAFPITAFAGTIHPVTAPRAAADTQAANGPLVQNSSNDLSVAVGQSVLVDTARPVSRVAVGLGDIAEATAISPSEILVNGKAAGETSLILWENGGGRQFFNVKVHPSSYAVSDRLDGVRREIRRALPGQKVKVSTANGNVFLTGTVKDLTDSERAVTIASTVGKVVNLLYVDVPASKPQILLKVRFASVDLSKERQLGLNLFSLGHNNIGSLTTGQFSPPIVSSPGASGPPTAAIKNPLNIMIFRPDLNMGATLEALETNGLVQMLAEPNLLAADGKEASFLAGGEYPYPVVQGATGAGVGAVTIEFKEYGVRLNFIPTITARNTIRLQVAPEVSALDFANGITISGFTVPGITARRVNTEVELKDGQSFAIGGLLNNTETKTFNKIPFIGDVPVLGKFFQSVDRKKSKTELIVIVTPEIVAPIPSGAPLPDLHYPEKFMPPNSDPSAIVAGKNGAKPLPTAQSSIPVEDLVKSMKTEKPLVIDQGGGGQGYGFSGGMGMGMSTATGH